MLQSICSQCKPSLEDVTSSAICLSFDCIAIIESTKGITSHQAPASRRRSRRLSENNGPSYTDCEINKGYSARAKVVKVAVAKSLHALASYDSQLENVQRNRIAHQLVKVFSTILDCMHELSNFSSIRSATLATQANNGRRRTRCSSSFVPYLENEGSNNLCHLFVELLALVSSVSQGHKAVWDGTMFVLLERAGRLLGYFVFVEQHEDATSKDQADRCVPYEADGTNGPAANEAPLLVWLLTRALALQARRVEEQPERVEPNMNKIEGRGQLSAIVLEKMQKTLLKAVFPTDEESFRAGFSRLATPEPECDVSAPSIRPGDVPNWYKNEIWRLVGWQVLSGAIDLKS